MKKILFLINHDIWAYNLRFELVEALRKQGHTVIISCPNGEKIKEFLKIGCEYVETNLSRHGENPIEDFCLFVNYYKIIKKLKPDIVFTYTIKPNIYGGMACRLLKVPYAANITGLGSAVENGGALQKLTVSLYKIAMKKAKCIFFQNAENMKFLKDKKVVKGHHVLLPGSGVNLTKHSYTEYPSDGKTEFVFVSRIMKEKGIDQYLAAAETIKKNYPDTVFHICGACEEMYEERLQQLHQSGIVVYHGLVSDIRTILKEVHCLVHPTYYPEGMSNVLLEASASGRPIITTDRSGCREIIDDGKNGYIVEQKNSEDLIGKIEKFVQLPYEEKKQMGINGRKKVEREFDRNIVVNAYLNELDR